MYKQIDSNKRKSIILIVLFVVIIGLVGWVFGELTEMGYFGLILALIIAVLMSLYGYFSGDKVALWTSGAKPITKEQNPYVYRMVENLSITAGIAMPKIHIISDPAINAFATGRDPEHASIAVTSGAIEKLENEELEGVLAHEMSHIKNYDIRLMTLVIICVGVIALLSNWFFRISFFGGRKSSRGGGQLQIIIMVIGLVLLIFAPIIAQLIKLAVSRKREFLADASGALLTRYPAGLANALEKIEKVNVEPMLRANNSTAHLYISNPFGHKARKGLAKLFSTHPPVEERIKTLREMA
ncbi:M48 family metallopeptidase [Patescibacteria group bacterium]|nr:M48 family metallopeptidase [Patescibacteria group bacterium]MBU1074548.1 M48 family metallopeptidase [Patescibacteria group bacterium]MBU1951345.1 M48 family metallopeptidase [Patescibacteria group bacterium]